MPRAYRISLRELVNKGAIRGPYYNELQCPKCGNDREFEEGSWRASIQQFVMDGLSPDWDGYDILDDDIPEVIFCAHCEATVWEAIVDLTRLPNLFRCTEDA